MRSAVRRRGRSSKGRYHFLDMGSSKYGECVLVEFGDVRILIDGGHQGDFDGQEGTPSIPEQLASILQSEPPFDLTLIVTTHCHADHVGCLPELVANDIVRPRFALLTDPKMGFGRRASFDAASTDFSRPERMLESLLREEDASDLDDAALAAFIDAAVRVEERYARFLGDLEDRGVDVVVYRGQKVPRRLLNAVAPSQMVVLGPSEQQLLYCAEQIEGTNSDAADYAAKISIADAADLVAVYRKLSGDMGADSRNARGNGMNCQSITLAFGPQSERVLLAGDMQFTDPGVEGAEQEVANLRAAVAAAGPFKLFKTTHHTSHNGQDEDFLQEIGSPEFLVHSGGRRDESHPYPSVLDMLKRRREGVFARTDRNGLITVQPHLPGDEAIICTKGRLNDFTRNVVPDEPQETPEEESEESEAEASALQRPGKASTPTVASGNAQIIIVNLPNEPISLSVAGVEIEIRRPPLREDNAVRGRAGKHGSSESASGRKRNDVRVSRDLTDILVATDDVALGRKLGADVARQAIRALESAGATVLVDRGDNLDDNARSVLQRKPELKGVILLGGYDVVPTLRTDAVGPELRAALGTHVREDADHYWVWSDKAYGDRDGDLTPEVPVSRVPDAGDSALLFSALSATAPSRARKFGIRNIARPFANDVWSAIAGAGRSIGVSHPVRAKDLEGRIVDAPFQYFMLHGEEGSGREFTGEGGSSGYVVAFTVDNVPERFNGVVFTGCCWGALTALQSAKSPSADSTRVRPVSDSIALSYLNAGAQAFVGCTGAHYSGPMTNLDQNYAARLHKAFWNKLGAAPPAQALHEAKNEYLTWIVNQTGQLDPVDVARRLKNVTQFTCLGLGW